MPRYAVKFSNTTGCSTLHDASCRNAISGKDQVTAFLEAPSVTDAIVKADRDGELTKRGFPRPIVCQCLTGHAPAHSPWIMEAFTMLRPRS